MTELHLDLRAATEALQNSPSCVSQEALSELIGKRDRAERGLRDSQAAVFAMANDPALQQLAGVPGSDRHAQSAGAASPRPPQLGLLVAAEKAVLAAVCEFRAALELEGDSRFPSNRGGAASRCVRLALEAMHVLSRLDLCRRGPVTDADSTAELQAAVQAAVSALGSDRDRIRHRAAQRQRTCLLLRKVVDALDEQGPRPAAAAAHACGLDARLADELVATVRDDGAGAKDEAELSPEDVLKALDLLIAVLQRRVSRVEELAALEPQVRDRLRLPNAACLTEECRQLHTTQQPLLLSLREDVLKAELAYKLAKAREDAEQDQDPEAPARTLASLEAAKTELQHAQEAEMGQWRALGARVRVAAPEVLLESHWKGSKVGARSLACVLACVPRVLTRRPQVPRWLDKLRDGAKRA
jgi:hypothetical protein